MVFVLYYFTVKKWLDRRAEYSELEDQSDPLLNENVDDEVEA